MIGAVRRLARKAEPTAACVYLLRDRRKRAGGVLETGPNYARTRRRRKRTQTAHADVERGLTGQRRPQRIGQRGRARLVDLTEELQRDVQVGLGHPRDVRGVRAQTIDRGGQPLPDVVRQQHGDEQTEAGYLGVSSSRRRLTIPARRAASGSSVSAVFRSCIAPA